jgi:hypothetical protein
MSWFRNNKTLCEELNATSTSTAVRRQTAVDGQYTNVRNAVFTTISDFAKNNKAMKTTVSLTDLFAEGSTVLGYFVKAVGTMQPTTPTTQETDVYGNKIVEELTAQDLVATYDNFIISVNWEVVPEVIEEVAVVEEVIETAVVEEK